MLAGPVGSSQAHRLKSHIERIICSTFSSAGIHPVMNATVTDGKVRDGHLRVPDVVQKIRLVREEVAARCDSHLQGSNNWKGNR